MGLFSFFFHISFEGVVANQIRYSIITAYDHLFSVLYTHLGGELVAEVFIYCMCGDSETVCDGKAMCMVV